MKNWVGLFLILFVSFIGLTQAPSADFSTTTTKVCVGTTISFSNTSSAGNSPIQLSSWDFGDGNTASVSGTGGIEHTYSSPGIYTVELLVIAKSSVTGQKKKTNYIEVLAMPKADFDFSGDICSVPATISIINKSSTGSGYSYKWNFGNGQSSTSSSPSPITYSNAGSFSVSLTLSNNYPGCSSTTGSLSKSLTIYDIKATITGLNSICAEESVSLVAKPNHKVDSYSWDFGNQTFGGNNDTISGKYMKAGSYVVALTMTDNTIKCSAKSYFKITVKPLPQPKFEVDKHKICPTFPVQFTNLSTEGSNFEWNFGEETFTGKNPPVITYKNEGDYLVSLKCKGTNGCFGTTKAEAFVKVHKPHPKLVADSVKGCTLLPSNFTDSSKMSDENNPIVKWEWDFGNGNTFTGKTPPKQIYDIGKYDIKLKVTTQLNCVNDTVYKSYVRVGRIEKVNFTVNPSSECLKTPIQFTDNSKILAPHTPDELVFHWDYGDGNKETVFNPKHAYKLDTGFFKVKLTVDFRGCLDSVIIPNAVYIKPSLANFTVQKLYCNPVMPVTVQFNDLSKSRKTDDVTVNWSFGNGKTGVISKVDMSNPVLGSSSSIFTNYGDYTAIQTVTNHTTGCVDTTSRSFYISWVKSNFSVDRDSICQLSQTSFHDASTSFVGHPLSFWVFNTGDGGQVSGKNPTYSFKNGGKFEVALTPTNSVGCFDVKKYDSLTVLALPKAVVLASQPIGCIGSVIEYSNHSMVKQNGVPMKSFLWKFDYTKSKDSTTNINDTKSLTYQSVGEYYAYLQVRDKFGCKSFWDSTKIEITEPKAEFVFKPIVCNNEVFTTYCKTTLPGTKNSWIIDGVQVTVDKDTLKYSFQDQSSETFVSHKISMASVDKNGCPNNKENIVTVSLPKANISYHLTSQLENNLNDKGEFKCPPIEGKFQNTTASIGKIDSSFWNFGVGKTAKISSPTINYLFPGTYSVTLHTKDEFGCTSDTTLTNFLSILGPKAVAQWSSLGDICGQDYTFKLSQMENVNSIHWSLDDNTFISDSIKFFHSYKKIQKYAPSVTLKDSSGCKVTYPLDTISIPEKGLKANFELSSTSLKIGQNELVKDLSFPQNQIVSWLWKLGDGDSVLNFTNSSVPKKYMIGGTKQVQLSILDKNGCSDQETKTLVVIDDYDVPNVITPNGDGVNDQLVLFDEIFSNYSISIFNRWGNTIYHAKDQKGKYLWDGTNGKNHLLEDGVYFYQLEGTFLDGKSYSKIGNVTLLGKD
jgi:gliding motility-associated-like protein